MNNMKKINTTVSTGDKFLGIDDNVYTVGNYRKIDGKNKIHISKQISPTSAISDYVSTQQLNKLIKEKL